VTGDSRVSILTPSERVLEEKTSVDIFEDESGWITKIPLSMTRQGTVLIDVVTEVNGENSTLVNEEGTSILTGSFLPKACFDCGGDAVYFADPEGFLEYGFTVNAYSNDEAHTSGLDVARYMHTQLHYLYEDFDSTFVNDDVDTCLIIQENKTLTPYANTGGGNITFNFTDITDEFFEFELFNIHDGATVFAYVDEKTIYEYPIGPAINENQYVVVDVPNIQYVEIQFEGPGAVCGIKSCLEGTRPPTPGGNVVPSYTISPTVSPFPSSTPSGSPSRSNSPSNAPSENPSASSDPSIAPSLSPSKSSYPSSVPSDSPSASVYPSNTPSAGPSGSFYPSSAPSSTPTESLQPSPEPTSIPSASIQPTDCYDLYGVTEDDIINQIGSEEPIPEDAIKIVHGENANVTIGMYELFITYYYLL